MTENIAIIPARSGSKRLKNKNTKLLGNKPLICWTIEAALNASSITRVVVSTDCEIIEQVALNAGAEVPFIRPKHLAEDHSNTSDVIMHAATSLGLEGQNILTILQPTSPFRSADHIDDAMALMKEKQADGVVSIAKSKHHPLWANTLPEDGSLGYFIRPEILNKRSQDLPEYYSLNGAIYAYRIDAFYKSGGIFYSNNVFGFKMSEAPSIDIDDQYDFYVAEALLEKH